MASEEIERLLTVKELSDKSGLTVKYLRRAVNELGLPSYRFGTMVKVRKSEFDQWINQRRVKHGA